MRSFAAEGLFKRGRSAFQRRPSRSSSSRTPAMTCPGAAGVGRATVPRLRRARAGDGARPADSAERRRAPEFLGFGCLVAERVFRRTEREPCAFAAGPRRWRAEDERAFMGRARSLTSRRRKSLRESDRLRVFRRAFFQPIVATTSARRGKATPPLSSAQLGGASRAAQPRAGTGRGHGFFSANFAGGCIAILRL